MELLNILLWGAKKSFTELNKQLEWEFKCFVISKQKSILLESHTNEPGSKTGHIQLFVPVLLSSVFQLSTVSLYRVWRPALLQGVHWIRGTVSPSLLYFLLRSTHYSQALWRYTQNLHCLSLVFLFVYVSNYLFLYFSTYPLIYLPKPFPTHTADTGVGYFLSMQPRPDHKISCTISALLSRCCLSIIVRHKVKTQTRWQPGSSERRDGSTANTEDN